MPSILQHKSTNATKVLVIGESGTGKSGALCSLIPAGFKLRILDFDSGLDIVRNLLTDPNSTYAQQIKAKNINLDEACRFVSITEHMKNIAGTIMPKSATVWNRAMNMLQHWKEKQEDGTELDFGKPRDWDKSHILVIDTLGGLAKGALNFVHSMNGLLGSTSMGYDEQRAMGQAQQLVERMLEWLYDSEFSPNVIVNTHILYRNPENIGTRTKGPDGEPIIADRKGFPSAIGAALSPRIPRYFNNVLQTETEGTGASARHKIYTVPQAQIGLKSSNPVRVAPSYPLASGLAEFFKAVRG